MSYDPEQHDYTLWTQVERKDALVALIAAIVDDPDSTPAEFVAAMKEEAERTEEGWKLDEFVAWLDDEYSDG